MTDDDSSEVAPKFTPDTSAIANVESTSTHAPVITSSATSGDQQFEYADVQIRVETAAHERRVEQQRLDHELSEESKDRKIRRWQEIITFGIVIVGVVGLLLGSFIIAATTTDQVRQTWAQGFATALAGAIGGAFAGYAVAGGKK